MNLPAHDLHESASIPPSPNGLLGVWAPQPGKSVPIIISSSLTSEPSKAALLFRRIVGNISIDYRPSGRERAKLPDIYKLPPVSDVPTMPRDTLQHRDEESQNGRLEQSPGSREARNCRMKERHASHGDAG